MFHADPLQVVHGAFEVEGFFAIELQECTVVFAHFFGGFQFDEEFRDFGLDPAVATDVHLPAGVHTDNSHILDTGFRAVARATGDSQFHLVRRPHVEQVMFQFNAQLC
ncbi:hypothetical protein D9M69_625100 [compost metagenome]